MHELVKRSGVSFLVAAGGLLGLPDRSQAQAEEHALVRRLHERLHDEAVQQEELLRFLEQGKPAAGFRWAFAQGEELFEAPFTALDGGGARVGGGMRYTRLPRPDLAGPGEWAQHVPPRTTGPNAMSCTACHDTPTSDGSGGPSANVHRDPRRGGKLGEMLERSAPHLFGAGAQQRLAEEMTEELWALRDGALARAQETREPVEVALATHGVEFGVLRAVPGATGEVELDLARVSGISADLIVRPFQWKGKTASLRQFTREACHEELGMQPVELVGADKDGDGDGVVNELTVGDVTALTLYVAGQPRPTTKVELAELGLIPPLAEKEREQIRRGEQVFRDVQCSTCHVPELVLRDPVFREPSAHPAFRDERLPDGREPLAVGLDPERALTFDLLEDMPDNVLDGEDESAGAAFGGLAPASAGGARVALFGDLKRHDVGPELAEPIDEIGTGAATFLTENLWGVGSTAPYLHEGRAPRR